MSDKGETLDKSDKPAAEATDAKPPPAKKPAAKKPAKKPAGKGKKKEERRFFLSTADGGRGATSERHLLHRP